MTFASGLTEDFETPPAPFTPIPDGGIWGIVDDGQGTGNMAYQQSAVADGGWAFHSSVMNDVQVSDGSVEVKFMLRQDPINSFDNALIYFRMDESGNGYAARLGRSNSNHLWIYFYKVSNFQQSGGSLASKTYYNFYQAMDEWHTARIEFEGDSLELYIDDTLQISATDSTYASGSVALGTLALDTPVLFDDLVVPYFPIEDDFSQSPAECLFTPRADGGNWAMVDDGAGNLALDFDADGNVLGGVRPPLLEAPAGIYGTRPVPFAPCFLLGIFTPFDTKQLADRYGSAEAYLAVIGAAVDAAIADGYLLPYDGEVIRADAAITALALPAGQQ